MEMKLKDNKLRINTMKVNKQSPWRCLLWSNKKLFIIILLSFFIYKAQCDSQQVYKEQYDQIKQDLDDRILNLTSIKNYDPKNMTKQDWVFVDNFSKWIQQTQDNFQKIIFKQSLDKDLWFYQKVHLRTPISQITSCLMDFSGTVSTLIFQKPIPTPMSAIPAPITNPIPVPISVQIPGLIPIPATTQIPIANNVVSTSLSETKNKLPLNDTITNPNNNDSVKPSTSNNLNVPNKTFQTNKVNLTQTPQTTPSKKEENIKTQLNQTSLNLVNNIPLLKNTSSLPNQDQQNQSLVTDTNPQNNNLASMPNNQLNTNSNGFPYAMGLLVSSDNNNKLSIQDHQKIIVCLTLISIFILS